MEFSQDKTMFLICHGSCYSWIKEKAARGIILGHRSH